MYEQFPEVMNMLWARMLKDNKKNWRRVYKVCQPLSSSRFLAKTESGRIGFDFYEVKNTCIPIVSKYKSNYNAEVKPDSI